MVGALVFSGLLLLLHIGLRLGRSVSKRRYEFSSWQRQLLCRADWTGQCDPGGSGVGDGRPGKAVRVALAQPIAAFVGGCAMVATILGLRLLFGGPLDRQSIWNTFRIIAIGGAALALLMALEVSVLVRWIRRTGLQWARISAMPELKIVKLLLPAMVLTIIYWVALRITLTFAFGLPFAVLELSAADIRESVRRMVLVLSGAVGGLMVGIVWRLIERSVQWRQVIIVAAAGSSVPLSPNFGAAGLV